MPLRFLTAGESHGPSLTTILDGLPAGLPLTTEIINKELARRQQQGTAGGDSLRPGDLNVGIIDTGETAHGDARQLADPSIA